MKLQEQEIKINIPKPVEGVIKALETADFEAYAVGGCIRDSILGRDVSDWDITTNALPSDVRNLFERCFDTGIKHGTVLVSFQGMHIEITTYRTESAYSDYRRPDSVSFTLKLSEDLSRRDFTVNAMAYNPNTGLVDLYGGLSDLYSRVIRTVGNPDKRFSEDALRIMRGVRFATVLGFEIEDLTFKSLRRNAHLLDKIAVERIKIELDKTLCSDGDLSLLHSTGILAQVIPELDRCFSIEQDNPHHIYNVGKHVIIATQAAPPILPLKWAAFLHDIGKSVTKTFDDRGIAHFYGHNKKSVEISREILNRLKFDNKNKDIILRLIKHHDRQIELTPNAVKRAISKVGDDIFELLIKLKLADGKGASPKYLPARIEYIDKLTHIYNQVVDEPKDISDLKIDGHTLMNMGVKGKEITVIKTILLEHVLEHPEDNTETALKDTVQRWTKNETK